MSEDHSEWMKSFRWMTFSFELKAQDPLYLASYKGSTFRGGFGQAFKKVVCALRNQICDDCILRERCIYSYVFHTPPPSDSRMMRKYPSAPHPFVLCPPLEERREYLPGDRLSFRLTLIGRSIEYLPYFVYTFDQLGTRGIGKERGKYEVVNVSLLRESSKSSEPDIVYEAREVE